MKKLSFDWILSTAAGAILGAIAVEAYRKHKAAIAEQKAKAAKPNEILIIEKL